MHSTKQIIRLTVSIICLGAIPCLVYFTIINCKTLTDVIAPLTGCASLLWTALIQFKRFMSHRSKNLTLPPTVETKTKISIT